MVLFKRLNDVYSKYSFAKYKATNPFLVLMSRCHDKCLDEKIQNPCHISDRGHYVMSGKGILQPA